MRRADGLSGELHASLAAACAASTSSKTSGELRIDPLCYLLCHEPGHLPRAGATDVLFNTHRLRQSQRESVTQTLVDLLLGYNNAPPRTVGSRRAS